MGAKAHHTKQNILEAAARCAERKHYLMLNQRDIATEAEVSTGLLSYHFGDMAFLCRDLMEWAIEHKHLILIAQGVTAHDPAALEAPKDLINSALASLQTA
jgi:AcrR family transcriptional regulator